MIHFFSARTCDDLTSHQLTCLKDLCSLKAHLPRGTSRVTSNHKSSRTISETIFVAQDSIERRCLMLMVHGLYHIWQLFLDVYYIICNESGLNVVTKYDLIVNLKMKLNANAYGWDADPVGMDCDCHQPLLLLLLHVQQHFYRFRYVLKYLKEFECVCCYL